MEEDQVEVIQSFWGDIFEPNTKTSLDKPEDMYTTISNVTLGDLPDNFSTNPISVICHVESKGVEEGSEKNVIAQLIPGKSEHVLCNHVLPPDASIQLEIKGDYPVHISGYYTALDEEEDIFDEEEEGEKKK